MKQQRRRGFLPPADLDGYVVPDRPIELADLSKRRSFNEAIEPVYAELNYGVRETGQHCQATPEQPYVNATMMKENQEIYQNDDH